MPSLVSVLVPTYEPDPAHLRIALDALLAQTEERWQAFIRDDASNADVETMVASYLKDPRIRFQRGAKRLGIGGNWNACLSSVALRSRAKEDLTVASDGLQEDLFIQFLFQDDCWEPNYLEHAVRILEQNPSVSLVASAHTYEIEGDSATAPAYKALEALRKNVREGRHAGKEFLKEWIERELHPNLIGEPSFVMLRQSLMEGVGLFAEDMPQFLDEEYWLRCILRTDVYFNSCMSGSFRVHAGGASAMNTATGTGIYDRLRCFERLIRALGPGDLKTAACEARKRALVTMGKKFFERLHGKKPVMSAGGGHVLKFGLRHPFLALQALFSVMRF